MDIGETRRTLDREFERNKLSSGFFADSLLRMKKC